MMNHRFGCCSSLGLIANSTRLVLLVALAVAFNLHAAQWKIDDGANTKAPGRRVEIREDGRLIAEFIYGSGQFKPYLHVFGENEELLTNSGLGSDGKPTGQFPHHRGIFIGWKINSDLGTDDLWHMTKNCKMEVQKVKTGTSAAPAEGAANLEANILWRAAKKDDSGSDLLLTETRTLAISRPHPKETMIDATFLLNPARDISLVGDLQHSGVHFRASNEVATRAKETSYLFEPDKIVKGNDMKWVRLLFPVGDRWYTAMEMNAPSNPVEELSMRDYGRFGYFFKRKLKKAEALTLKYRFVIEQVDDPADKPNPSTDQLTNSRAHCQQLFKQFVDTLR